MVALNRAGCFLLYLMRPATKSAMDFLFEWLASAGCQDGHLLAAADAAMYFWTVSQAGNISGGNISALSANQALSGWLAYAARKSIFSLAPPSGS